MQLDVVRGLKAGKEALEVLRTLTGDADSVEALVDDLAELKEEREEIEHVLDCGLDAEDEEECLALLDEWNEVPTSSLGVDVHELPKVPTHAVENEAKATTEKTPSTVKVALPS